MITLIGDIHGHFVTYEKLIANCQKTIQLGDFGVGFDDWVGFDIEPQHRFIRGNHDNPSVCKEHPNYLGDYGFLAEENIFYISGADSIDKDDRTIDIDWWHDEQLSYQDLKAMMTLYGRVKPKTIISHDCPEEVFPYLHCPFHIKSRTQQAMNQLLTIHRPKYWIFAHYHLSCKQQIDNTLYTCLDTFETLEITV